MVRRSLRRSRRLTPPFSAGDAGEGLPAWDVSRDGAGVGSGGAGAASPGLAALRRCRACHDGRGRRCCALGDLVENRGQARFELSRARRGEKFTSGRFGDAAQRLQGLLGLHIQADDVNAEIGRRLFQVLGSGADIRLAAVRPVGHEQDVEIGGARVAILRRLHERRRDRLRDPWLEACAELQLAGGP